MNWKQYAKLKGLEETKVKYTLGICKDCKQEVLISNEVCDECFIKLWESYDFNK